MTGNSEAIVRTDASDMDRSPVRGAYNGSASQRQNPHLMTPETRLLVREPVAALK